MITGARISPDGTRVAVGTATPRDHQPGNPIQGTGDVTVEGLDIHRPVGASSDFAAMSWSPDGSRLYIKSTSSEQRTSISMWSAATDTVEHVDLPFGGLLQLVVVTADEIGALPDHAHVAADCPAVDQNSDGTRHDCAFGF
jgi:hypothetical protein